MRNKLLVQSSGCVKNLFNWSKNRTTIVFRQKPLVEFEREMGKKWDFRGLEVIFATIVAFSRTRAECWSGLVSYLSYFEFLSFLWPLSRIHLASLETVNLDRFRDEKKDQLTPRIGCENHRYPAEHLPTQILKFIYSNHSNIFPWWIIIPVICSHFTPYWNSLFKILKLMISLSRKLYTFDSTLTFKFFL